jgi:hypothetical protein
VPCVPRLGRPVVSAICDDAIHRRTEPLVDPKRVECVLSTDDERDLAARSCRNPTEDWAKRRLLRTIVDDTVASAENLAERTCGGVH